MNTGIQDAADLADALVAALRTGNDAILDGYEARRRPIAQRVVATTDKATRMATLTNPVARAGRNAALTTALRIPAVNHALAAELAELHTGIGSGGHS
jgi:2-polyprenyl-6-methoxyphenol hydroxylase-like FAD-dependent oxidoreductase